MKNYLSIIKQCPLFEGIQEDNLRLLLNCLDVKIESYDKKNTILSEGRPAKHIGVVLDGSAQIQRVDYYGNRSIVGNIGVSQIFGEEFACAGLSETPVKVVSTSHSTIMLIDCNRVLNSCSKSCGFHRQLIYNLMKGLAGKNIDFHQRIEITSKRTTRDKLMAYLMFCAKKEGKNAFSIPFDRQELADYLDVDRSGLSVQIGKLRDEGVIKCSKNHFEILQKKAP